MACLKKRIFPKSIFAGFDLFQVFFYDLSVDFEINNDLYSIRYFHILLRRILPFLTSETNLLSSRIFFGRVFIEVELFLLCKSYLTRLTNLSRSLSIFHFYRFQNLKDDFIDFFEKFNFAKKAVYNTICGRPLFLVWPRGINVGFGTVIFETF